MAKFNIVVDTEEESVTVNVGGADLPNVSYVSISKCDDSYMPFYCSVCYEDENELRHTVSANKKEYKDVIQKNVAEDIAKRFRRNTGISE